jgi:acyl-coenzyme A thioesterase PaaI-like protein
MSDVFAGLQAAVPFVRTLGLEEVEVTAHRAALRLPDVESQRNHVGGPHAGAMFSLGESASGAVVLQQFGATLGRATPLAVAASIRYLKLALGPVTATATSARTAVDVLAELDAGERPEFEVAVVLTTEDGTVTGEMTVLWTLRPNRTS